MDMKDQLNPRSEPTSGRVVLTVIVLIAAVATCAIYANLSIAVTNKDDYQYFPPFKPGINANDNDHLGAEYFNMARSLVAGQGFANPFLGQQTGPTAWMPPILPYILAGLLWMCEGSRIDVLGEVVFFQVCVLSGTGWLVIALAQKTTRRLGPVFAATAFLSALLYDFHMWFQFTHDCWLVLLALNLLITGLCWSQPLHTWRAATAWGLFGGLCALINPIVGLVWTVMCVFVGIRQRAWSRLAVAAVAAGLMLAPWTIRNYLVFNRFIPIKSNLSYELYQSQCLQDRGRLQRITFVHHPYHARGLEREQYQTLGETGYLDLKRQQFLQAVEADPWDFLERVGDRFLAATIWYEPMAPPDTIERPWLVWFTRLTHPLPFLALLFLMVGGVRTRLSAAQWIVMGVYILYLLPYIVVSYYDRYGAPLIGVKVLLVIWAIDRLLSLLVGDKPTTKPQPRSQAADEVGKQHEATSLSD
jgi:hypothetical protein